MSELSSLSEFFDSYLEPWNLVTREDGIFRAGRFESTFEYFRSFFSSLHQQKLEKKATELFQKIEKLSSEEAKVLQEKVDKFARTFPFGPFQSEKEHQEPTVTRSFVDSNGLMKPIIESGRFVNRTGESIWSQFFETMRLLFPGTLSKATDLADLDKTLANRVKPLARSIEPQFTWLGHSTLLLQLGNMNFLFDPSFGFCPPCFPRHTKPGIERKDLPLIDCVFVSHNHADHCEKDTLMALAKYQPHIVSPQNFGQEFAKMGLQNVHDMKWWQTLTFEKGGHTVKLTSVPALHNSQTTLSDINKSHWHGCVIEYGSQKYYFAGDTAYNEKLFSDLKQTYGAFDAIYMPVAPEGEQSVHVNAEEALKATRALDAKTMYPIHYGAYRQSKDTIEKPLEIIQTLLKGVFSDLSEKVIINKIGQRMTLTEKESVKKTG